jgi:hypothetical protein
MNTLLSIGSIAVASLALNLTPVQPAQAVNLVLNGDFTPISGTTPATKIENDSTTIPNWTSSGYNFLYANGLNATGNTNTLLLYTPGQTVNGADNTNWFIAADGSYGQGPISQQVNGLTSGQQYNLTFYQAAGQQNPFSNDTTSQWAVNIGGTYKGSNYYQPNTVAFNNGTNFFSTVMSQPSKAAVSGWTKQTFTFTANGTSELLSFLAEGTPTVMPPFSLISAVSIEAVTVPEPLTLVGTLFGLGLGAGLKSKLAGRKLEEKK